MSGVRRFAAAFVLAAMLAALPFASAQADDGDASKLAAGQSLIGQQWRLELDVATARGATVEVDPAAGSWNGIEVVRVESSVSVDQGDRTLHHLILTVAPFLPGQRAFAPQVNVVKGAEVTPRQLPPAQIVVVSTLANNDPLELSPLAEPRGIEGAESPLLRPAIGVGIVAGVLLVAAVLFALFVRLRRVLRKAPPVAESGAQRPGLEGAEALLHADAVAGYRSLAAAVRAVITERHRLPAHALTTGEIQRRMESQGVDRWEARLVGGLLAECDAVVYAGYRPAAERREHDLTMARTIVRGSE